MEKFVFLETVAFLVIGVLGIKLTASVYGHFYHGTPLAEILDGETADLFVSVFTVTIFVIPVLTSLLFNFPKQHKIKADHKS
jgi:predicted tellurium resistance membrane protein TerC